MSALAASVQTIFDDNSGAFLRRVTTLEQGVGAILAGSLGESLRAYAEADAHKLAGSLGTFGLPLGSELATRLEQRFAGGQGPAAPDDAHLTQMVVALRKQLEAHICASGSSRPEPEDDTLIAGLAAITGHGPVAVAPGRILVVDDDLPVREVLASILSEAGYDVRHVGSAKEAREVLEHDTIALLLSDVSMPGETGLDLIRFALCEHPETATLLISALEDPAIAQVAMDYGAYGYLYKPVRRSAVLIGVMNALRRRDMKLRERRAT